MITRALLGAMLLVGACGYGPPAELACDDLARAVCNKRAECTSGTVFPHNFADLPSCVARQALNTMTQLDSPGDARSPLHIEQCAISYPALSCADFATNSHGAACDLAGTLAMGAPCASATQCQTDYCSIQAGAACGTCATPPVAGSPCSATSSCARGQICYAIPTGTCLVPTTLGGACTTTSASCAADLVCLAPTGTAGTCQPATTTVGAPCGTFADGACDNGRGLYCQGTGTRACALAVEVTDGEPCGALDDGIEALCSLGGTCETKAGAAMGICRTAAVDGAACDIASGPPCLFPARCVVPAGSSATATTGVCTVVSGASCR